jgi:RNA polymerase sigma-70 factor (ECF subfamily)
MPQALYAAVPAPTVTTAATTARLQALFSAYYDLVWRFIRRLGVPREAVDDAAQDAFVVVARRLADIEPGKDKAFLFSTAYRIAAEARRKVRRANLADDAELEHLGDTNPRPDELIDRERARALCDRVLETMPLELRAVFVLFQSGDLTMAEIASHLDIPAGTVASRIRRARELFEAEVGKLEGKPGAR